MAEPICSKLIPQPASGPLALRSLDQFAPDFLTFARAIGLEGSEQLPNAGALGTSDLESHLESNPEAVKAIDPAAWLAHTIYRRVVEKLRREPVEDFRIDYEDGYGNRPDAEEDGHAQQGATEVAAGMTDNSLPPFIGIRIKPFTEELRERSVRTLDLFVSTLLKKSAGLLPANFVVTLPKITIPEQVTLLSDLFDALEQQNGLAAGSLKMEMMIETTQSIINDRGEINLPLLLAAARGRCVAAHFGTYDYTASCSVTAAHQHMMHPACDFAKSMMQVSFAGQASPLSDGATKHHAGGAASRCLEMGPHEEQIQQNQAVVERAWKLQHDHIQHSLVGVFIGLGFIRRSC
jgi:citrate lyase beta subunit